MSLGLVVTALSGCFEAPVDPDTAIPARVLFGEPGTSPGQFAYPRAMESVEHNGVEHLFVIDKAARIQWFENGAERPRALWQTPRFDRGKPTGLAVHFGADGQPTLYIADTHESRILIQKPPASMGAEPETVAMIGRYGYADGEFIYPCDIEILTDESGAIERFYVAEYGGHDRISAFDAEWNFLFAFGEFGNAWEDGGDSKGVVFNRPQSIDIDRLRGVLYVADAINHRVGRFTLDGELLGWLGQGGPSKEPGRYEFPYSLDVRDDGTLLVGEYGNSRVQMIDPVTGGRLALFGAPGRDASHVLNPWEIAVRGDELLVLDSGNARVSVFDLPSPGRLAGRGGSGGGVH